MSNLNPLDNEVEFKDLRANDLIDIYFFGAPIKVNCLVIEVQYNEKTSFNEITFLYEKNISNIGFEHHSGFTFSKNNL